MAGLPGALAGCDARPQNRREEGRQPREVAHHAAFDEPLQVRHSTGIQQVMNDLPVGRIPADEEESTLGSGCATAVWMCVTIRQNEKPARITSARALSEA